MASHLATRILFALVLVCKHWKCARRSPTSASATSSLATTWAWRAQPARLPSSRPSASTRAAAPSRARRVLPGPSHTPPPLCPVLLLRQRHGRSCYSFDANHTHSSVGTGHVVAGRHVLQLRVRTRALRGQQPARALPEGAHAAARLPREVRAFSSSSSSFVATSPIQGLWSTSAFSVSQSGGERGAARPARAPAGEGPGAAHNAARRARARVDHALRERAAAIVRDELLGAHWSHRGGGDQQRAPRAEDRDSRAPFAFWFTPWNKMYSTVQY